MIWLVGAKGMLGTEVGLLLQEKGVPFVASDKEVSILDYDRLKSFSKSIIQRHKHIHWIVNCAGYTLVDKAEEEVDICYAVNVLGPQNLGRLASILGASIIHISTDYVFSGESNCPYTEEAQKSPICVYGRSKAQGEEEVLSTCDRSLIIRTAWLYGKHGRNFVYTMLRFMNESDEVKVVNDQWGTPTWTKDLAEVILKIINGKHRYGIYHYTNEGKCTWFQFAEKIYELGKEYGIIKRSCKIKPIKTCEFSSKAKRPSYSVMSKEKIKKDFQIEIPSWELSLERFIKEIAEGGQIL